MRECEREREKEDYVSTSVSFRVVAKVAIIDRKL
jgi:hypothetical protein